MKDKVVLLDVMSTLVRDPFQKELPRAFGYSQQEFIKRKRPGLWPRFERGGISEGEFLRQCLLEPGSPSRETVHQALREGYRWLPGIQDLLDELRSAGVSLYALSNYPVWYRIIDEVLGCSHYFSWEFVSCRTGYRKPEQTSYVYASQQLGIPPRRLLFVDDRPENLRPARYLGFGTHHFRDVQRLRQFLHLHGILPG